MLLDLGPARLVLELDPVVGGGLAEADLGTRAAAGAGTVKPIADNSASRAQNCNRLIQLPPFKKVVTRRADDDAEGLL